MLKPVIVGGADVHEGGVVSKSKKAETQSIENINHSSNTGVFSKSNQALSCVIIDHWKLKIAVISTSNKKAGKCVIINYKRDLFFTGKYWLLAKYSDFQSFKVQGGGFFGRTIFLQLLFFRKILTRLIAKFFIVYQSHVLL